MIHGGFRPWGSLSWLLKHLAGLHWDFIGSIATGERSLTTWSTLISQNICNQTYMLQITDIPSAYWGNEPELRLNERRQEFLKLGGDKNIIQLCDIRDNLEEINQYTDSFLMTSVINVIIDISTLPKRFFFPIIRRILEKSKAENIIATYTIPKKYDTLRHLAIDPGPWKALPGYQGLSLRPEKQKLIVGLGYEPLGLPQIIKEGKFNPDTIRLLFPFPATPAGYLRNWEFVRNLDIEFSPYQHEPLRVNGYDVSGVFNCIFSQTDNGREYTLFAPYGTKPMSLAMCLYAIYNPEKTAVYYTQPRSYNPNYSIGVKTINDVPDTYAYCIRLMKKDLYALESN
jgi:hypothetical protein